MSNAVICMAVFLIGIPHIPEAGCDDSEDESYYAKDSDAGDSETEDDNSSSAEEEGENQSKDNGADTSE
jgi:hypothetical protein